MVLKWLEKEPGGGGGGGGGGGLRPSRALRGRFNCIPALKAGLLATPGPRSGVGSGFLEAPPPLLSAAAASGGSHTGVSVAPPSSWPTGSRRSSSFSARLRSILTGAAPQSRSGAPGPASRPQPGDCGGIGSGGWRPIRSSPLLKEPPSRMCRLSSDPPAPPLLGADPR